jgi:DNA mismatch repair ATPase MutS
MFSRPEPAPDLSLPALSLLFPSGKLPPAPAATAWEEDIGLNDVLDALQTERRHRLFARQVLVALLADESVIGWRQAVLQDLVNNPTLLADLETLLPKLGGLDHDTSGMLGGRARNALLEITDRLSELDLYTESVIELQRALGQATLHSGALQRLQRDLAALSAQPDFAHLRQELPKLREPLQAIGSLTVAINLDSNLQPSSAVLVSVQGRQVGATPSFLDRLLGLDPNGAENGISAVHRFPHEPENRRFHELFQDVDRLMQQTAKPIATALRRYLNTNSQTLIQLEREFAFFVKAARLMLRLQAQQVAVCMPNIAPMPARLFALEGLANLRLALQPATQAIANPARFDDEGRIAILTGPNSGGKTTYLQSVGIAQVMAQAGLFVLAESAQVSPVDTLLTHFPRLETRQQGRLAEEAARLRQLFEQVTPYSLVLLNETFSSTAFGEALYLAQDVLCALCAIGARGVFATHLVELVEQIAFMERSITPQSHLYSLVAGIESRADGDAAPTFRIQRGEPLGRSYAREIAKRHGISLEQILNGRGSSAPTAK